MAEDIFDEALRIGHAGRSPPTMAEDMIERLAMVLAWQRRLDMGDDERFHDDGTREGYWRSLTDQTRELMRLRAQSALGIALDPEDEALVERVAHEYADPFSGYADPSLAKRIIATLRTLAQGEQA